MKNGPPADVAAIIRSGLSKYRTDDPKQLSENLDRARLLANFYPSRKLDISELMLAGALIGCLSKQSEDKTSVEIQLWGTALLVDLAECIPTQAGFKAAIDKYLATAEITLTGGPKGRGSPAHLLAEYDIRSATLGSEYMLAVEEFKKAREAGHGLVFSIPINVSDVVRH